MTWVKLDDNALDDATLLTLDRGARLMHLEALAWSNRQLRDGAIPRAMLRRLTDEPDPEEAAAALVQAGLWTVIDEGWQLVWLLDDQPKAAKIRQERDEAKDRMARIRDRTRRHNNGDHDQCDPKRCWVLRSPERSPERSPVRSGTPPRPLPTDKGGRRGERAADARSALGPRTPRRKDERCWRCGNPAPDGLELAVDAVGHPVHPSGELDEPDVDWDDEYPGWSRLDLEALLKPDLDYPSFGCPPMADGHDECLDCHGAFPIDEMTPVLVGTVDGQGQPVSEQRLRCATCTERFKAEVDEVLASAGFER